MIQDTMEKFFAVADVKAVYGEPIREGDTTVIPTAEVLGALGFGIGEGGSANKEGGFGSGGGGGGRSFSRPVAVIVIGPGGVEVKPVLDITKIALAGITAWGFMLGTAARMFRRPRRE
jgi:uncharacterized spore protein YtfJ